MADGGKFRLAILDSFGAGRVWPLGHGASVNWARQLRQNGTKPIRHLSSVLLATGK